MDFAIRDVERRDCADLVRLIGELAAFEQLSHLMQVTPPDLERHLFGARPVIEAVVAERAGSVIGFALFFVNFSTFLGKPGLYLEDLIVQESERGRGVGKQLLIRLARIAVERDYGRFEWSVLDWNANAIAFYQKMGASVLPDWRICRVTGDALQELGAQATTA